MSKLSDVARKPFSNSYWAVPGQLLAGEYPLVKDEAIAATRLQDLLLSGVNCFINLTVEGELPGYQPRLPARFSGKPVAHQRFAIPDHGVPTEALMLDILDAIDAALAAGSCVYVHCRAGIGRTGTVIGCHMVRRGARGNDALTELNKLWQSCGRAASWPTVPETDEQENFVRQFRNALPTPAKQSAHAGLDAYQGALLGLAMGDALGSAISAQVIDIESNNSFQILSNLPWGSHTAMSLALADSVLVRKALHAEDQMQRYLAWQKQGRFSATGQPGVLPMALHKALGLWQWKRNPLQGSHDPALLDAHPLARCTPIALYFARQPPRALLEAAESARTSLQAPVVLDACRVFAALLLAIVERVPASQLFEFGTGHACAELRSLPLKPELLNLINGGWRTALTDPARDDVLSVLASAIHALATTSSFQSALLKSLQGATQPAQVASVCGALAGALYGVQGLPIVWRETLIKADELLAVSERLLNEAAIA